jgi:hypothetical protein
MNDTNATHLMLSLQMDMLVIVRDVHSTHFSLSNMHLYAHTFVLDGEHKE